MLVAFGCIALVLLASYVPFSKDTKSSAWQLLLQRLISQWMPLSPDETYTASASDRDGSAADSKQSQDLVAAQELRLYKTLYS